MDNQLFGNRIAEARKKNGMTQKDLAERLDVTDKAVSKWECGKGFPEITLLPKLSRILGIKPEELLSDKAVQGQFARYQSDKMAQDDIVRHESDMLAPGENVGCQAGIGQSRIEAIDPQVELVTSVIQYSGEQQYRKLSRLVLPILSASLGLAVFVCLLVDFSISQTLTWSRFPVSAILFCFTILLPVFLFRKHRAIGITAVFFVVLMPFLFYLESLVPAKGWVIGLAIPIAAISAVCTVLILWLFLYSKADRMVAAAITFAMTGIGLNLLTNEIVLSYLDKRYLNISVFITASGFAVVTIVLLITALVRRMASNKAK